MINKHRIQDLVTCIINDGSGSQCGSTYTERCKLTAAPEPWLAIAQIVNEWNTYRGGETATPAELLYVAAECADYYAEHAKEM
jgi:hypothetical protein